MLSVRCQRSRPRLKHCGQSLHGRPGPNKNLQLKHGEHFNCSPTLGLIQEKQTERRKNKKQEKEKKKKKKHKKRKERLCTSATGSQARLFEWDHSQMSRHLQDRGDYPDMGMMSHSAMFTPMMGMMRLAHVERAPALLRDESFVQRSMGYGVMPGMTMMMQLAHTHLFWSATPVSEAVEI